MSATQTLNMCCASCGSEDVLRDAWACWNVEEQAWELDQTFDHAFCGHCEGDCTIEEIAA